MPPWPARSTVTSVAVNRLSHRQATNMIGGMTRGVPLPEAIVERIVERADGVPLFVEEVTKMVLESDLVAAQGGRYELTRPLTDLAIPSSLQDSLMARLDRLDAGKPVAQLGAALGREFFYELLRSVSLQEEASLIRALQYVPMRVMGDLLGVPREDVPIFAAWADALSPVFLFMSPAQIDAATDAIGKLLGYLDQLVDQRRRQPDDDLISALIAAEDQGNRLTHEELLDMVANLIVGGHDTTASQIGCTLFELLGRPEIVAELAARPHRIASAVDETLRLQPVIIFLPRTVIEPVEVAGTIRAPGTLLGLATSVANRDPVVWDRPDDFVVDRFEKPDVPRLLTFGTGSHYCLGANLARMTLEEAVRGLVENPSDPAVNLVDIEWRMILGRSPASLPIKLH